MNSHYDYNGRLFIESSLNQASMKGFLLEDNKPSFAFDFDQYEAKDQAKIKISGLEF